MKYLISIIIFFFATLNIQAQTIENGVVKEYHGKEAKTNLSGVELIVKGAPSTVSDAKGAFALRFSTLKPGDKVDYSEIYKAGYVIFNKDALDAWRISGNGALFTVIMCRESDFRALKKKFYGIIENSYKVEYERQKKMAEQSISDALELRRKVGELKKEYDEKLGNINTYVELFSRIDRSEMDSVEAKALRYVEIGDINRAIEAYEELQLSRQVHGQIDKWDAGVAMVAAGNDMIEQVKTDLMALVEKMQKQIGLYEMGGSDYDKKREARIEEVIPILYRLNAVCDGQYNETLGRMIIERSKFHSWSDRLADYREAAAVPSAIGLSSLGRRWEMLAINKHEYSDSARLEYEKILTLHQLDDSIQHDVKNRLLFVPKAVYKADDGNEYPFGLWGEDNAEAYLCGYSSYVSTHLEGDVTLPDEVSYDGKTYPVTGISYFAFGNNKKLRKVVLPKHLKLIGDEAFVACSMLDTVVAPSTLNEMKFSFCKETVITFPNGIEDIDFLSSLYIELAKTHPDHKKYAVTKQELLKAHARSSAVQKEHEVSNLSFNILIENLLENRDSISALNYARENVKLNGAIGELTLGEVLRKLGNYDEAFAHYKKALKTGDPSAYNQMAYSYALPEFKRQNFKKAHELIDIAIEKSVNDTILHLNFLDSKGEIFLLENKVDDAKIIYGEITSASPDFYTEVQSVLCQHFCPQQAEKSENVNIESNDDITNLQKYIDLVQLVAKKEQKKTTLENFRPAEYEELLSIGILAVQVLIKNKTPEQLKKYNFRYIATAVTWAIRNEMRIRYDWYNLVGPSPVPESRFADECAKLNIDYQQFQVLYAVYLNIKDVYNTALEYGQTDTPAFKEFKRYIGLILKAKDQMTDIQKEFVDFYLTRNATVYEIEKRFELNTIIGAINIIRECFNANNQLGY